MKRKKRIRRLRKVIKATEAQIQESEWKRNQLIHEANEEDWVLVQLKLDLTCMKSEVYNEESEQ